VFLAVVSLDGQTRRADASTREQRIIERVLPCTHSEC
jgi:hypothetical protein